MQNLKCIFAFLRRLQTWLAVAGKSSYLSYGHHLHVGKCARLWAPKRLVVGDCVYIGKYVHIEANCRIGNYCLIANRVAIVGRHDHKFSAVGFPMRFAPWVGSKRFPSPHVDEEAVIEDDVWLGYGTVVLTGVTVGRGSVVAAGSVVAHDIPPYSIAAGVPAKVTGQRFQDLNTIALHEAAIRDGRFRFSELGYDHCVIEPCFNRVKP
ncbi:MAG: CatB-related O-acetyltransferase [Glaciimonas sp.]|nr:CatB-related O-acetyltransferase [Glaciimonas sp.]